MTRLPSQHQIRALVDGRVDGRADGRSLSRNHGRGDVVRKRAGDDVIGGDRKLHIGIAGEYDQSDFILMKLFDQPVDREFGAFESVRFEILRQHAVRYVDRQHHFDPRARDLFQLGTELRSRQADDDEDQRQREDRELGAYPFRRGLRHQSPDGFRVAEAFQRPSPDAY